MFTENSFQIWFAIEIRTKVKELRLASDGQDEGEVDGLGILEKHIWENAAAGYGIKLSVISSAQGFNHVPNGTRERGGNAAWIDEGLLLR